MLIVIVPFIIAYLYCLHYTPLLDLVGAKRPSEDRRRQYDQKCIGKCSPKKVFNWSKSTCAQVLNMATCACRASCYPNFRIKWLMLPGVSPLITNCWRAKALKGKGRKLQNK
jgi:hypothetical protein